MQEARPLKSFMFYMGVYGCMIYQHLFRASHGEDHSDGLVSEWALGGDSTCQQETWDPCRQLPKADLLAFRFSFFGLSLVKVPKG